MSRWRRFLARVARAAAGRLQVAPFSLLTFEHARRWADSIAEVISEGRPCPLASRRAIRPLRQRPEPDRPGTVADPVVGRTRRSAGDLSRGADPSPRRRISGRSGQPDIVCGIGRTLAVPAEGVVPIHRIRVATNLDEDVYVQAAEAKPGDRAIVHHICVFVEDPATAKSRTAGLAEPAGRLYPRRYALRLPRRGWPTDSSRCEPPVQVHYTPIGKPRSDRSSVGLILTPERRPGRGRHSPGNPPA